MSQHKEKVLSDHLAEQLRGVPNLTEPAELLARQRGESLKLQQKLQAHQSGNQRQQSELNHPHWGLLILGIGFGLGLAVLALMLLAQSGQKNLILELLI